MAVDTTPAYPRTGYDGGSDTMGTATSPQEGMLIADVFAIEAFKVLYPVKAAKATVEDPVDIASLATECYEVAKKMFDARNVYLD